MTKGDDHVDPTLFNATDGCFLQERNLIASNESLVFFIMDFENNQ